MRISLTVLLFILGPACFATLPAWGDIIVDQQGAASPASNGFANDFGVTSQGPVGTTAWNIQGDWCCGYDYYSLTSSQITDLTTATNWAFIATYQNLSPDTGPGYLGYPGGYGSYAVVQFNGVRFDLGMHSDGSGDQVLSLDPFGGSPNYTIAGLGTSPVTLEALYNNSTGTANIFVNGTEVISNYAGHAPVQAGNLVFFGGEDGTFSQVELETTVPEPSTFSMLALSLLACFLGVRRKTKRSDAG
jgi:hypothetical protein